MRYSCSCTFSSRVVLRIFFFWFGVFLVRFKNFLKAFLPVCLMDRRSGPGFTIVRFSSPPFFFLVSGFSGAGKKIPSSVCSRALFASLFDGANDQDQVLEEMRYSCSRTFFFSSQVFLRIFLPVPEKRVR
jgi:hypothetical protein